MAGGEGEWLEGKLQSIRYSPYCMCGGSTVLFVRKLADGRHDYYYISEPLTSCNLRIWTTTYISNMTIIPWKSLPRSGISHSCRNQRRFKEVELGSTKTGQLDRYERQTDQTQSFMMYRLSTHHFPLGKRAASSGGSGVMQRRNEENHDYF